MKQIENEKLNILAIETSCDETSAAVVIEQKGKPIILTNIVNSQVDLHAKTNGIVPEVASRAHLEAIVPVVSEALIDAFGKKSEKLNYNESISLLGKHITHIAYTAGPGLIGSLLVGGNAAKSIAVSLNLPIVPVNHIEGHIYSVYSDNSPSLPLLALTVSGGHTSLTFMSRHIKYQNIGHTIDDAAGEAFDKVAKLLDLGYPGGPIVSFYAEKFRSNQETKGGNQKEDDRFVFPRPIINDGTFNFSFSGLKTAVLQKILNLKKNGDLSIEDKQAICAAFEDAVVDVLVTKSIRACQKLLPKTFVLAGGVAANKRLRERLSEKFKVECPNVALVVAPLSLCGDNAGMIGLAAYYKIKDGKTTIWQKAEIDANLEL